MCVHTPAPARLHAWAVILLPHGNDTTPVCTLAHVRAGARAHTHTDTTAMRSPARRPHVCECARSHTCTPAHLARPHVCESAPVSPIPHTHVHPLDPSLAVTRTKPEMERSLRTRAQTHTHTHGHTPARPCTQTSLMHVCARAHMRACVRAHEHTHTHTRSLAHALLGCVHTRKQPCVRARVQPRACVSVCEGGTRRVRPHVAGAQQHLRPRNCGRPQQRRLPHAHTHTPCARAHTHTHTHARARTHTHTPAQRRAPVCVCVRRCVSVCAHTAKHVRPCVCVRAHTHMPPTLSRARTHKHGRSCVHHVCVCAHGWWAGVWGCLSDNIRTPSRAHTHVCVRAHTHA